MDWSRSYTALWRVFRVNRDTWADGEQIRNADEISITRTADGTLLESGSMVMTGELDTDYYRIVLTAQQDGDVARVDVATLLFESKGGSGDHGTTVQNLEGYSVLHPAATTTILSGEYAPAGVDGAAYAKRLLDDTINAPVEVHGTFTLNEHVVHEIGSTVLDAVWSVLKAGNFVIQIDGRGIVHILPQPTEPSLQLDSSAVRLLSNGIDIDADYSGIPNRYIVLVGNNRTVAVNEDPDSPVSTMNRGYYIDVVDESPKPVNGETIGAYALRKLHEASVARERRTYKREYAPEVNLYSLIRASINHMNGDFRVESQTLECGHGIVVTEKAYKEVSLW